MGPKVLAGKSWEDTASRGFHPLEAVCFQTVKQEIRRISIRKLRLAVELLNKETHHRDVMSFFSVLSYQAARSYIEMNRLVIFMSQVLSMYGSTSAGMDIGVARMPMTTL